MSNENEDYIPENNIEFSMVMTNPVWGSDTDINQAFRDKTTKYNYIKDLSTGEIEKVADDKLWEQLQFFTRDLRLGNLSSGEVKYCQYYLNLAGDFLKEGYKDAFIICLNRVASITELSQSKGGFLRNRLNTFTKETKDTSNTPKRSGLFHQANSKGYQ